MANALKVLTKGFPTATFGDLADAMTELGASHVHLCAEKKDGTPLALFVVIKDEGEINEVLEILNREDEQEEDGDE